MSDTLYQQPVRTMRGETTTLAAYQNQVLLIVNVASRCGFTKQYAELEALYQTYRDKGFAILGFPCNQFLKQEPGDNTQIKTFAEQCYHVSFPLFAKCDVKGAKQCPLYTYLAAHIEKKPWLFIPWNFTKILVDQNGRILRQYLPTTPIHTIQKKINTLLS